jgi:uncharacterized protein YndB with AHSA1/START domain
MALPIREGDIPGIQLRVKRRLDVGRAEAWRWLTEPRQAERWLADRVEIEPGPRGRWRLEYSAGGRTVIETAQTDHFDPPRSWVLQFRQEDKRWEKSTRLEIALLDDGAGCEVDVLQVGFHHLAMSSSLTIWEEYRRRWRTALERLARETG